MKESDGDNQANEGTTIQLEGKSFDYKDSTSGVLGESSDPLSSADGSNTRMICSVKGTSEPQSPTADNTDRYRGSGMSSAPNPNKNREKYTENLNANEGEHTKNILFPTMEGDEEEPRYSEDRLQNAMELCGLQNEGGVLQTQPTDLTSALPEDLKLPKTLAKLNTENISFTLPPSKSEKPYVPFGYNSIGNAKQPMNSYMIWRRIHYAALAKANPTASSSDIHTRLGWEWRRLPEDQKRAYYREAWKLKTKHRKMFPDWKFTTQTEIIEKSLSMANQNSSTSTTSPYTQTTGEAGYYRYLPQFFLREPLVLPSQHFLFQPRLCEKGHNKQHDPMISGFTRDFTCFDADASDDEDLVSGTGRVFES